MKSFPKFRAIGLNITAFLCAITGANAQDMFIGSADAMYLHSGAVVEVSGNITSNANINGAGTAKIQLFGTATQLIDMNNNSVYGLSVNKSSGKAVLIDSIKVANLELLTGKFLLYSNSTNGFTLNVTGDIKNATSSTRVLVGSRNSTVKFSGASATADTLYLTTDTLNHSNYLKNLFVGNSLTLNDTLNIAGLTYISSGYTLNTNTPGTAQIAYLKLATFSSTSYGQLQFESGATLLGKATLGQLVTSNDTWIHWGSPFATSPNTTYGNAIADDVTLNYATDPFSNSNIFYYDESQKNVNSGSAWARVGSSSDQIARGRGHGMYTWEPNEHVGYLPTTSTYVLDITGTITASAYSSTFNVNQNPGVQNSDSIGWQIIANPYYCNANLANIDLTDINTIQGNTLYYYQTTSGQGNYNTPPLAYNFHLNSSNNGATGVVRPLQALYFRLADTTTASQNITFPVKMQGSGNTATAMWKGSPFSDILSVKAQFVNDTNYQDATTVFIMPGAENNADKNDAFKFVGDYSINVYTSYNNDNSRKMSYNALADEKTSVPLGFTAQKDGKYILKFNLCEQEMVNDVTLEDKVNNSFTKLTSTDNYTFDYSTTQNAERFVLHFNKDNVDGTSSVSPKNGNIQTTNVYVAGSEIKVDLPESVANFKVSVTNLLGQQLDANDFTGDNASLTTSNLASGYYLVAVTVGSTTTTKKVFVNN